MKIAALIVAAGRGSRAGGEVPKQYAVIGGSTVIARSINQFVLHPLITMVLTVIHSDDRQIYDDTVGLGHAKLLPPVSGGATRQQSVHAGLEALELHAPEFVLIHDAARPFTSPHVITNVAQILTFSAGAIAAVQLADTLKRAGPNGTIAETIRREDLWRAQTPQGFRYPAILAAHRKAAAAGRTDFTDDAAIAEWAGLEVALVQDSTSNIKLTTAEDIAAADRRLRSATGEPVVETYETRTGTGFDVHKFCEGDHVWLGGVKIPHTHSLEGHSDADVALHALTDAILGAIGDGDIGQHFPPSDPKWRGAASKIFLEDAARRVRERGGKIVNVDVTVLAEDPKIGPHREAMQAVIAEALGITPDRVGIKATTTEGLGFIGRHEGIAAMAVATVRKS